jgi:hypothetical protein
MKNGLEDAYKKVVQAATPEQMVTESTKDEVIGEADLVKGQSTKTGQDVFDDYKEASGKQGKHKKEPGEEDPKEPGKELSPGHGDIKTEGIGTMLPTSKFDELFKKQLVEEELDDFESDESPLETGEFDDDSGEFPSEDGDDAGEEVDVATELRMVIDRLSEVAERLGAYDDEAEEAGEEVGEMGADEDLDLDDGELEESHVKLEPLKDTTKTMTSPGNKKVKTSLPCGGQKARATQGPMYGKKATGQAEPGRKTTLGPHGTQKHPDVKGTAGKTGAGVFDNI